MTGTGKLGQLVPKKPWPYVNHYSFHILDPDWWHVTIKMSGHPPFGAQVILNGHEYVAAQAQKAGIGFTKQENCFTVVNDAAELAKVADTLSQKETAGHPRQLCERWIYSTCLCFALDLAEQEKSTFQYQYSVFQMEYSRNLLFRSGRQLEEIFQALIDRTRAPLDLDRIKTIFGDKNRPHYDKRKKNPTRWGVVVETPTYDLTVFKVHYGKMTLKIYTKGARVLRVAVIVHNTKEYRWGRSLPCFGETVTRLRGILERFLNAGILRTPVWAPKANAVCERLGGSLRRECLDFLIPVNERHLKMTVEEWRIHYNRGRPHSSLGPRVPESNLERVPASGHRHKLPTGYRIAKTSVLGGLHHEYRLVKEAA
jgi:hypothetical protein